MKIAYCGYDFFYSCFEELIEEGHEVIKVFSFECDNEYDFNTNLRSSAEKRLIPYTQDQIRKSDIEGLQREGCDLIVAAAYPYKIPVFEGMPRAINIHPSLLPEGRGGWPLPWIILKDLRESGSTIHKISEHWDTGDILVRKKFQVQEDDNLETISAKSQLAAQYALKNFLMDPDTCWQNAEKQSEGSYWSFPVAADRTIDWNTTYKEIDRMVRAFGKFDSFTRFDDKKWLVQNATCWEESHSYVPGVVVHRMNKEVVIACKDGFVCLRNFNEYSGSRF